MSFQVFYLIGKQTYKLKLSARWRIYKVFHMSILEQDTIRKGRINEFAVLEFDKGNNKEYKIEIIWDNAVYTKKADRHLLGLYYLVAWKGYPEEKNTWEPFSAIMHLQKMVSTFYKNHPKKPIANPNYLYFINLLRDEIYHFLSVTEWRGVNCRLDATRFPPLWRHQPCHWYWSGFTS